MKIHLYRQVDYHRISVDIKALQQNSKAMKERGLKAATFGSHDYFKNFCDAMSTVMQDKI